MKLLYAVTSELIDSTWRTSLSLSLLQKLYPTFLFILIKLYLPYKTLLILCLFLALKLDKSLLIPSDVMATTSIKPLTGLRTRPIAPLPVPFSNPLIPSFLNPCYGKYTDPTTPDLIEDYIE